LNAFNDKQAWLYRNNPVYNPKKIIDFLFELLKIKYRKITKIGLKFKAKKIKKFKIKNLKIKQRKIKKLRIKK
jgi:hypothetical protein